MKPAIPGWRFTNSGVRHNDYPGKSEWADHLGKLVSGEFEQGHPLPEGHVLSEAQSAQAFRAAAPVLQNGGLALTWFGHASFLIRTDTMAILTDPIFTKKTGPAPFGIERLAPVRPDPQVIDRLDAVVISHGDYDHMSLPTLRRLALRFPEAVLIVPEGSRAMAAGSGFTRIVELGRYETLPVAGARVTGVPAVHAVRRLPWPINHAHWNGYRIDAGGHHLYFSGDTGAGEFFSEIRRKTGPSRIALVPAGAWAPRDFEKPFHVNPREAIELAQAVGAREAVAMHWGTFALSEDRAMDQKRQFMAAARGSGTRPVVMAIGETRTWR